MYYYYLDEKKEQRKLPFTEARTIIDVSSSKVREVIHATVINFRTGIPSCHYCQKNGKVEDLLKSVRKKHGNILRWQFAIKDGTCFMAIWVVTEE